MAISRKRRDDSRRGDFADRLVRFARHFVDDAGRARKHPFTVDSRQRHAARFERCYDRCGRGFDGQRDVMVRAEARGMVADDDVMAWRYFAEGERGLLANERAAEVDYHVGPEFVRKGFVLEGELPRRAVRREPDAGGEICEERHAERIRERGHRLAIRRAGHASGDEERARRIRDDLPERRDALRARLARRKREAAPRLAGGSPRFERRGPRMGEIGRFGFERLAEGQVQMHRASGGAEAFADGVIDRREHRGERRRGAGFGQLEAPARVAAENILLADGLVRAGFKQLEGAVSREHEHRHRVRRGFDDGGEVVGHGGAGGADKHGGHSGRPRVAERVEGRRALVGEHAESRLRVRGHGERQRRRARAGGDTEKSGTLPDQFLHDDRAPERGGLLVVHVVCCVMARMSPIF